VHEPDKSTYLVLPPTTEMCSTLHDIFGIFRFFVLNSEKVTVVCEKQDISYNSLLCFIAVL